MYPTKSISGFFTVLVAVFVFCLGTGCIETDGDCDYCEPSLGDMELYEVSGSVGNDSNSGLGDDYCSILAQCACKEKKHHYDHYSYKDCLDEISEMSDELCHKYLTYYFPECLPDE